MIWLPSEAGPQPVDEVVIDQLVQLGVEVWRVDLVEAHFLPVLESSMDDIPAQDISALVDHAVKSSGKSVAVITSGRGAIPVLRGLRHWQLNGGDMRRLTGAVLLSPKLFIETPDPGHQGELMPVVAATNLPLFILQPDQSPWYWKLQLTLPELQHSGSDVYTRILRKVRDRFYFRPDATGREKQFTEKLPMMLAQSLRLLDTVPKTARRAESLTRPVPPAREGKKDHALNAYRADPNPPELVLPDMNDQRNALDDYRGKVVLINFWATWCPPCVHEMPSMQRLKEKMAGRPFVILAVNMAEDKNTVKAFLQTKVAVDFPILFDYDGKAIKAWQVFAFPTSFVIDKSGKIKYALFGSIDWDEAKIVEKLTALATETVQ